MNRRTTRVLLAFLATGLLFLTVPVKADERFLKVEPTREPGSFVVEIESDSPPGLWLDGKPFAADFESAGDGRFRATVTDIPADAARLSTGKGKPAVSIPIRPATVEQAPFNDRVVYHIMVGYFANGARANDKAGMRRWTHRRYAGGDLQGILGKADYLGSLGITDVWLSPIFQSETSHGYDVQDYYRIGDSRAVPGSREASLALEEWFVPVDAAIIGIVDSVDVEPGQGTS